MIVLGIQAGHNATAALLKDNEIIAAISEERLLRYKNVTGYPRHAIDECFRIT
jgi:carbamoyltransferase